MRGSEERRRQSVEGVFDGLRVAPGRIDTVVETKSRRMNLQVRTDFVDVRAPAQILERIDGVRKGGSAARDVDYAVIRRDIIDFKVNVSAYLRSGPAPPGPSRKSPVSRSA